MLDVVRMALILVSMMLWISAKLTLVMLCVVPPVSLFAVRRALVAWSID